MSQETFVSIKKEKKHIKKKYRFPRTYKIAEKILKDVDNGKGSVKSVFYSYNIPKKCFPKVFGICQEVMKHKKIIDNIIRSTNILKKDPGLRKEAAEILIHELVFKRKGLLGQSKPVAVMRKYTEEIHAAFSKTHHPQNKVFLDKINSIPRYARIHTLSISVSQALADLKNDGYERVRYDKIISLNDYENLVLNLQPQQFVVDYHFKDLLVFQHKENLSQLPMFKEGQLFLQDKTSYVPVHVLAPEPGSTVLDACAAPGMKTAHLASVMNNKGFIYAFDRNEIRFRMLTEIIKRANVEICTASCSDFTRIDPNMEQFSSVDYILLDPSCSGSGMASRQEEVLNDDKNAKKNNIRLKKLQIFQEVMLKHALSFPNVKRVVYSTCSINEEENEWVVEEALKMYEETFEVVPAMPTWPVRGYSSYPHGKLCFRADPCENLTGGFFVAVFERKQGMGKLQKKRKSFSAYVKVEHDSSENSDYSSPQAKFQHKNSSPKAFGASFSGKKNRKFRRSQGAETESDVTGAGTFSPFQAEEFKSQNSNRSFTTPSSGNKNKKLRLSQGYETSDKSSPQIKEFKIQMKRKSFSPNVKEDPDSSGRSDYSSPQARLQANSSPKAFGDSFSGQKNRKFQRSQGAEMGSDVTGAGRFSSPQAEEFGSQNGNKSFTTPGGKKNKKLRLSQGYETSDKSSPQMKEFKIKSENMPSGVPSILLSGNKFPEDSAENENVSPQTKISNVNPKTPKSRKKKNRSSVGQARNKQRFVSPQTKSPMRSPRRVLKSGKKL